MLIKNEKVDISTFILKQDQTRVKFVNVPMAKIKFFIFIRLNKMKQE